MSFLKKLVYQNNSLVRVHLLVLFLLGLLPFSWFKGNLLISGGDWCFPLGSPSGILSTYLYVWASKWGLGLVVSRAIPLFTFQALLSLGELLGLSLQVMEKALFCFLFTCGAVSIYLLTVNLIEGEKEKRIAPLFAALFYMFNPFTLVFYWHWLNGCIFVYALLPLIVLFYIKGIVEKKARYAFYLSLVSMFGGYTFSNPLFIPLTWSFLFSFGFYFILKNWGAKNLVRYIIGFTLLSLAVWCLFNMWWFLPLLGSLKDEISGLSATVGYTPFSMLEAWSRKTDFLNLLRLMDCYWAFGENYFGDPYYSYAASYSTPFFIVVGFFIPILVFLPLLSKKRDSLLIPYLSGLALVYLFMAKGTQPPFGESFYRWLFCNIPFAPALRAPIEKFGVSISIIYAILFGCGISAAYSCFVRIRLRKVALLFLSALAFVLFGVHVFPLWTGEVIIRGGDSFPSYHVRVPKYYNDANTWLDGQQEDFRFFQFPVSESFHVAYKWQHGYVGGDPSFFLFSKPGVYSSVQPIRQMTAQLVRETASSNVSRLLRLQNVKYVILHNDANLDYLKFEKPLEFYRDRLRQQSGIRFDRSFGKLDFYKLDEENFLPHIYAAPKLLVVQGDIGQLISLSDSEILNGHPAILFTKQAGQEALSSIPSTLKEGILTDKRTHEFDCCTSPVSLTFQKINPTKYIIHLEAERPFCLVFLESYHPGWKIYAGKSSWFETLWRKPLPNGHFMVNGYANAWCLRRVGEYDITLYFWPQNLVYIGFIISGITFLSSAGYLLMGFAKARSNSQIGGT